MMAKRRPDTGLIQPYRPCPKDFRDTFLRMGWDGIDEHYRTNWRVIRRWIEESGGEDLRRARAEITGSQLRPKRRSAIAKLYVQGKRVPFTRIKKWPTRSKAPRFWELGLIPAPLAQAERRTMPPRLSVDRAVRLALTALGPEASADFEAGVRAAVAAIQAIAEEKED